MSSINKNIIDSIAIKEKYDDEGKYCYES